MFHELMGIINGLTNIAKAPLNCPNEFFAQIELVYTK